MPAYTKLKIAELRELCEERGIDYQGLNKAALVDALRQDDQRAEEETDDEEEEGDDGNDAEDESDDGGGDIQLGEDLFSDAASVLGANGGSGQAFAGENGESESLKALRLQLALREKELELKNAELRLKERDWEIERQRLELQGGSRSGHSAANACDVRDVKALLPTMSDGDVLSFFMSYERVMLLNDIDKTLWAKYLPAQLTPKALKTYTRLSLEESRNYDKTKQAILDSFQLTPESYFKLFRTMKRTGNCTYSIFLNNMRDVLQRYCEASKITELHALFDAILKEHFLLSLPNDVQAFVLSHQATCNTVDDLGKAADLCYQVKRISNERHDFRPIAAPTAYKPSTSDLGNAAGRGGNFTAARSNGPTNWRGNYGHNVQGQFRGNGRGRPGLANIQTQRGRGASFWACKGQKRSAKFDCDVELSRNVCEDRSVGKSDLLYADHEYVVPLYVNGVETQGIRDTGCAVVLVSKNLIEPESINYEKCINMKGAFDGSKSHEVPTAVVKLRSPRFLYDKSVEVTVGVTDKLPPFVDCLLGNSLFKCHPELTDIIAVRRTATDVHKHDMQNGQEGQIKTAEPQLTDETATNVQVYSDGDMTTEMRRGNGEVKRSDDNLATGPDRSGLDTNANARPTDRTEHASRVMADAARNESRAGGDDSCDVTVDPLVSDNAISDTTDRAAAGPGHKHGAPANVVTRSGRAAGAQEPAVCGARGGRTVEAVRYDTHQQLSNDNGDTGDRQKQTRRTDGVTAERSAGGETDTPDKVLEQLRQIDTDDLRDEDDIEAQNVRPQGAAEFACAQQNDVNLKHLWLRAKTGSSELCVIDGLLYRKVPHYVSTSTYEFALVVPTEKQNEVI